MIRHIRGNVVDEKELSEIETIWATNYMNSKVSLLGTISLIRLDLEVFFL
jgi:hypothetical protein